MSTAQKFEDALDATVEEADKLIRIFYTDFTMTRSFIGDNEGTKAFFESLKERFSIKDWETTEQRCLRIARNLLLNVGMIKGTYSPALAHPCFLDKEDTLIFYRCLALLSIEGWNPKRN